MSPPPPPTALSFFTVLCRLFSLFYFTHYIQTNSIQFLSIHSRCWCQRNYVHVSLPFCNQECRLVAIEIQNKSQLRDYRVRRLYVNAPFIWHKLFTQDAHPPYSSLYSFIVACRGVPGIYLFTKLLFCNQNADYSGYRKLW